MLLLIVHFCQSPASQASESPARLAHALLMTLLLWRAWTRPEACQPAFRLLWRKLILLGVKDAGARHAVPGTACTGTIVG
jgi:hypothetical protein